MLLRCQMTLRQLNCMVTLVNHLCSVSNRDRWGLVVRLLQVFRLMPSAAKESSLFCPGREGVAIFLRRFDSREIQLMWTEANC